MFRPRAVARFERGAERRRFAERKDAIMISFLRIDIGTTKSKVVDANVGGKQLRSAIWDQDMSHNSLWVGGLDRNLATAVPFSRGVSPPRLKSFWVAHGVTKGINGLDRL